MKEFYLIEGKKYLFYSLKNENKIICSYLDCLGFICKVNGTNYSFKTFENFNIFLKQKVILLNLNLIKEFEEKTNLLTLNNLDKEINELKELIKKNAYDEYSIKCHFYEGFIKSVFLSTDISFQEIKEMSEKIIRISDN